MSDPRRIIVLPTEVYDAPAWKQLNKSDVDVLMAVGRHINRVRNNGWPAIDTIATLARVDRRTAQRSIKKLERLGLIELDRSRGRSCHHYAWPNSGELATVEPEPTAANLPLLTDPNGGESTTVDDSQQRRVRPSTAANPSLNSGELTAQTRKEHGRNIPPTTGSTKKPPAITWKRDARDGFEGTGFTGITDDDLRRFADLAPPGVDIKRELRKAHHWLADPDNPTRKNIKSFLNNWFKKERPNHDRSPNAKHPASPAANRRAARAAREHDESDLRPPIRVA